jgi:two-component system chemotaxis response regulator CheY
MAKTIMVVDDSLTMLMSVKSALEANAYNVITATSGADALNKISGSPKPDLILTDLNMPNMDGLTLIKNIKSLPGFKFTPILILTTESQAAKRDEGKRLGATGWIVKPVSGHDLIKVVKQVLPGA